VIETMPNAVELLQRLIRFDTTNPPGNEAACMGYIQGLLAGAGIESTVVARDPARPNLIARLAGRGEAAPLLMYGHVDVVTTANQPWSRPAFAGDLVDGYVWGRGALDMKGGVAMMLSALLRAAAEGLQPAGDIIFCALSDEEAGSDFGADYVVAQHADLFAGVKYAIGEFGGFTMHVGGKRFYPVQVAEKQVCWMSLTVRGQGGHGSMPVQGGAMAKLARALTTLDRRRLPVHVTPVVRDMLLSMADAIGGAQAALLRQLLNPRLTDFLLDRLGDKIAMFNPLLHNTVSPTILHGSSKINVIPDEVTVQLDGRLLPGFGPDDMKAELRQLLGAEAEIEIDRYDPGPPEPNMGLFGTLGDILMQADPGAIPIPLLLSGVTDARAFARLGIQSYGFTPMKLPADFAFLKYIHTADERVPAEAVLFGHEAVYRLLQRFRG